MNMHAEEVSAPIVRDLTAMTGAAKNQHRRTVFVGRSVSRLIFPMLGVGVLSFTGAAAIIFPIGVVIRPIGTYWFLWCALISSITLLLVFYRVKKSMNQRAYKALRDFMTAENGQLFIDGYPVLEPQLVYHQALYLDRDPDELRDIDVAYITPTHQKRRKPRGWIDQELTQSRQKRIS